MNARAQIIAIDLRVRLKPYLARLNRIRAWCKAQSDWVVATAIILGTLWLMGWLDRMDERYLHAQAIAGEREQVSMLMGELAALKAVQGSGGSLLFLIEAGSPREANDKLMRAELQIAAQRGELTDRLMVRTR